jgi:hypothetical protein
MKLFLTSTITRKSPVKLPEVSRTTKLSKVYIDVDASLLHFLIKQWCNSPSFGLFVRIVIQLFTIAEKKTKK